MGTAMRRARKGYSLEVMRERGMRRIASRLHVVGNRLGAGVVYILSSIFCHSFGLNDNHPTDSSSTDSSSTGSSSLIMELEKS